MIRSTASHLAGRLGLLAASMIFLCVCAQADPAYPNEDAPARWTERFVREVDHRLDVPLDDRQRYILLLQRSLAEARLPAPSAQAFVLVDRSTQIQAAMVILRTPTAGWHWVGAAAVSTGKTGSFDHFLSPLGVFAHTPDNPDFRADGTFNKNHIRGYGLRGRRVFDFGWQLAERGWGDGGTSRMRLQMHATDPRILESRLGRVASEGCVRIPATLNVFLDAHGLLDADYDLALAGGKALRVLEQHRDIFPWPGRYLVIVDSHTVHRPPWSPPPGSKPPPDKTRRVKAGRSA